MAKPGIILKCPDGHANNIKIIYRDENGVETELRWITKLQLNIDPSDNAQALLTMDAIDINIPVDAKDVVVNNEIKGLAVSGFTPDSYEESLEKIIQEDVSRFDAVRHIVATTNPSPIPSIDPVIGKIRCWPDRVTLTPAGHQYVDADKAAEPPPSKGASWVRLEYNSVVSALASLARLPIKDERDKYTKLAEDWGCTRAEAKQRCLADNYKGDVKLQDSNKMEFPDYGPKIVPNEDYYNGKPKQ